LHPAVADAAVIARPDDKWSEVPLGLVVVKPNHEVTEKELIAHVRRFITAGVLPREAVVTAVRFVEAIDRTGVGKTNKVALREKYLG
jgi:fatty-acyl-CoA synthase